MQKLPSTVQTDSRKLVEDLYEFLGTIVRGWRLIAVCVGITLALAVIYLARVKPVYLASARLLVLQHGGQPLTVANGASSHDNLFQSVDEVFELAHDPHHDHPQPLDRGAFAGRSRLERALGRVGHRGPLGQAPRSGGPGARAQPGAAGALFYSVVDQLKQAQLVSGFGSVNARVLDPPVATENRPSIALVLLAALAQCDTVFSSSPLRR